MNYINQLQADNLELNQRLHATQEALINFKGWYSRKHDAYAFEALTMLNGILSGSYPVCDTIIEDVPTTNLSGITCKCEQLESAK
jgi:hypothetical protein